ncbi:MAG: AAA family ATPase [Candidatus Enterosoma sp.]|nr:AAA family ATPase [bacterium]MDY4188003.1 AAA family ATPase [Candidatus Enterosoma sp.]
MRRLIFDKLIEWKNSSSRKPLLLKGARQVGKTYALLEFGRNYYDNVVYLHFEGNTETLNKIFAPDLNPKRIIEEISVYAKQTIFPNKTLIIFDEIQACEQALTSLKYFAEEAPEYHIIAAGSLLGLAINRGKFSFPVGKVDMLTMYPMSFEEFLLATNNDTLIEKIRFSFSSFTPLADVYHNLALELYKKYLVVGGYPAVVKTYLETEDFDSVRSVQADISDSYIADMTKYATPNETIRSIAIFNTLPSQLAKENTKFQYAVIKSNARAKDYELSLQWLKASSVVLENIKITEGKLSLSVYEQIDSFKIYYSDVGLLCFKSGTLPQDILINSSISDRARGLLAENYVAEQLVAQGYRLNYWESDGKAELDFVIRQNDSVVPVEVKSADNVRAKSLKVFIDKYSPSYSIRISARNFGFENGIKSVPLYAVFCL